jgi:hypothetical protein
MKKIILIIAVPLIFATVESKAQAYAPTVAGDTISASSAIDTVSKTINIQGGYQSLAISVKLTKVSGNPSTLKAYLYKSNTGETGSYTLTDSSSVYANSSSAQYKDFMLTGTPYNYYRVDVRCADGAVFTTVAAVKVWYNPKRQIVVSQ